MWLNQKKTALEQNTAAQLAEISSNGIELSINELIQYQNKSSLINLASRKNRRGQMSGNYLARSKGRGMEFDEVRHYQNGDDIRAIDWRVTARTGITHTKLFREEIERPVLIATDLSHNMLFGSQLLFKSVQAGHLAALVAWHARVRGDRIGGIVFNQHNHTELKPRSRQQGVLHYLHALVETHKNTVALSENLAQNHQAQMLSSFEQNCARLRQLAKPGSLVYLLTDGSNISSEAIRHLSYIGHHCELVVCLISDPLEHQLPDSKDRMNVAVTDGYSKQQLTIGDPKAAEQYQQLAHQIMVHKEELLSKAGARLLTMSAGQTLELQLTNGVASWIR